MLLKYFYDQALAHASYLVGCQKTGEAIIVDPGRDIQQYLDVAAKENMRMVGVAETHIHADYVSGARELADRVGARLYVSDEGPPDWKYLYLQDYDHQLLKEGDTFSVGQVEFQVLHTPGHTPESISFVLTDKGGGADRPMGIFSGDFVFVGSIGRPDLLEEAAGLVGTAEPGARDLFQSAERFKQLPDYLQVWPAHGAGSACGKGLGAIPSSTVGYEKMFNPALQFTDQQQFVDYILAEQPEPPKYFALMKRVNKEGPRLLGDEQLPAKLPVSQLPQAISDQNVIDTANRADFVAAHVPGSLSLPLSLLAMWGGSIIDYQRPLYLIAGQHTLPEANRILRKIGVEQIAGYFDADEVAAAGLRTEAIREDTPQQLQQQLSRGEVSLVDVRGAVEWNQGHIKGAQHHFLPSLLDNAAQLDSDKPIVFQCRSGGRSVVAASIAQAAGIKNVINLKGGITAWQQAGLPVEQPAAVASR